MSSLAEIESAIEKLSPKEKKQLRRWMNEREEAFVPAMEKLRRLAGSVQNLPSDMALNHDHYLHGRPKQSE
jgi:hypothetical protein